MANQRKIEIAQSSLLMRSMPDEVSKALLNEGICRHYGRGETIFLHGEKATVVHIVLEGWVKIYRVASNGNEAIVNVFTRGSSFGEAFAFRQADYIVSAEAVTECELMLVPTTTLTALMKDRPEICVSVLSSTFQHLHSLIDQVEQIKAQTGAQRVAEFLLELCPQTTGSCVVTLPYDKVLIAGRLGMKPESLSRAFSKLRPIGVRIAKNHAMIDDCERLRNYTEEDPAAAWNKAL